jgi:hypothetical protein
MSKHLNDTLVKLEKLMTYNNQGRNMIEEEKLKRELQIELEQKFPSAQANMDNNIFLEMQQKMVSFVTSIQQDELNSYLVNRDENKCVFKHFAEYPLGVAFIEKWIHTQSFEFSKNIFSIFKSSMTDDSSYSLLAKLFDSKDLDSFILQSNLSESDEKKLIEIFTPAINNPEFDLLLQAMSSTLSGANNATQSLLKLWSQSLNIDGHDIQEIIARAKEIEIKNGKGTKDSLASNNIKHDKSRIIEEYTIQKFVSLPDHLTMKPIDVINSIVDDIIDFSLTSEDVENASGYFKFYDEIKYKERPLERPRENIRKWIRKYKKSLKIPN